MRAARILAAAERLLLANDGELEMSQVAEEASVSVGLAYHYFGSKSGMLGAIIDAFYDRYNAVVNQYIDPDINWGVREKDRLLASINFLYSDAMAPMVLGKMAQTPQVVAIEAARQQEMIELATRNIRSGMSRGHLNPHIDPDIAAAAITGAMRQCFIHAFAMKPRPDAELLAQQLWGLISGAVGLSKR